MGSRGPGPRRCRSPGRSERSGVGAVNRSPMADAPDEATTDSHSPGDAVGGADGSGRCPEAHSRRRAADPGAVTDAATGRAIGTRRHVPSWRARCPAPDRPGISDARVYIYMFIYIL